MNTETDIQTAERPARCLQRFVSRQWKNVTMINADCLDVLSEIKCAAIVTDVPYGETRCGWDVRVDCEAMWKAIARSVNQDAAVITTATQPVAALLISSNLERFAHEWIWEKNSSGGFAVSKYAPMRYHENVLVFKYGKPPYNPIKREYAASTQHRFAKDGRNNGSKAMAAGSKNNVGKVKKISHIINIAVGAMPKSVLKISSVHNAKRLHPTEKPVELMEYMVRTYTNDGATVCDPYAGSGTTAIACFRTGRKFIGIEKDPKHYQTACERIDRELAQGVLLPANAGTERQTPPNNQ